MHPTPRQHVHSSVSKSRHPWRGFSLAVSITLASIFGQATVAYANDSQNVFKAVLDFYQQQSKRAGDGSLYLRAPQAKLRVERVRIRNAQNHVREHVLSPAESAALADGAALWLAGPLSSADGFEVELIASARDASYADTPSRWRWRAGSESVPQNGDALTLQLQSSFWLPWRLRLKEVIEPDQAALVADYARLLGRAQRPLLAAATLLRAERIRPLPAAATLALETALSDLGITQHGLQEIASGNGPLADKARLYLARKSWRQGRPDFARQYFSRVNPSVTGELAEMRDSLAITLGHQQMLDELSDRELTQGDVALAAFNRLAQASTPASRDQLDRIGSLEMQDELGWVVRDRANLVLGYWYLRTQNPPAAEAAFSRIRLTGPAANAGRLGLGWAQISPGRHRPDTAPQLPDELGELLRPRSEDDLATLRRSTPFRTAQGIAHGALAEGLQRALIPWAEMIGADPLDPAVQESMLAIPYALAHLGAHEDALARLQNSRQQLEQIALHLRQVADDDAQLRKDFGSAATAWESWVPGLSASGGSRWWRQEQIPGDFYTEALLRSGTLAPSLQRCKQFHDAIALTTAALTEPQVSQPAGTTLLSNLNAELQRCEQDVITVAKNQLRRWVGIAERYLAESQLALARLHDSRNVATR